MNEKGEVVMLILFGVIVVMTAATYALREDSSCASMGCYCPCSTAPMERDRRAGDD